LTVANGVDVARFSMETDLHDERLRERFGVGINGAPVVLAVGGIEARKNTLALLEAFASVRTRVPHAQCVIAGGASLLDHDAYARQCLHRAAQLGLAVGAGESVIVTGPLDDEFMPALFRCADVLSMVSLHEGFGLVVLEALACGTPVVASAIAPFTEYLDDRTCIWADPLDPDSIATALLVALGTTDSDRTIDFKNAVPALLARFSWQASAQLHVNAYAHFTLKRASAALAST
jgi:glycosyltransferase-like protein